jgi:hypothetical protein
VVVLLPVNFLKTRSSSPVYYVRTKENNTDPFPFRPTACCDGIVGSSAAAAAPPSETSALFAWLISHQPAVLFSQNKSAISNQPAVLFSQNKSALAISHQPTEQAAPLLPEP